MSVTLLVFQLLPYVMLSKARQPSNMPLMVVTLRVSNVFRARVMRLLQFLNMPFKLVAAEVLKFVSSRVVRDVRLANSSCMSESTVLVQLLTLR